MLALRHAICPLLLALAGPALAQGAPEAAKKHFEDGKRLFREGKQENNTDKMLLACGEFRAAYAGYASKNVLWNLIICESTTNRHLEAMKHLREYVRNGRPPVGSDEAKELKERWDPSYAATGHLEIEAPPGAEITVAGEKLGRKAPLEDEVDVPVGVHVVEARLGDRSAKTEIAALSGRSVKVRLVVLDASPAPAVTSRQIEPPPPPTAPPPAGDKPAEGAGSPARYIVSLSLVGAGAAAVVAGIAFGGASNTAADQADTIRKDHPATACSTSPQPSFCSDASDATDRQNRDATLSKVFLVSGVALIAGGAAAFLFWPKEDGKAAGRVTPAVGRGYFGMGYMRSF